MQEQSISSLMMEYLNEASYSDWEDGIFDESTFCIHADLEEG